MLKKIPQLLRKKVFFYFLCSILSVLTLLMSVEIIFREYYKNKISHKVYFQNMSLTGFNKADFVKFIDNKVTGFQNLTVNIGSNNYKILLADIDYSVDAEKSWETAKFLKKTNLEKPILFSFIYWGIPIQFKPTVNYNEELLLSEINKIVSLNSVEPVFEKVFLNGNKVEISAGKDGYVVDEGELYRSATEALVNFYPKISIAVHPVSTEVSENTRRLLTRQAENLIGKKIYVNLDDTKHEITDHDLVSTLNDRPENAFENIKKVSEYISDFYNKEPKDSVFIFENGKVTEFVPSEKGVSVDAEALQNEIIKKRDELLTDPENEATVLLPHKTTEPTITLGNINNLGINEKIGTGASTFKGSITSRIHNIKLASSKFNGVLLAPGETLSFNKTLGDVSKVTGYQQAYIIQDGQTILGDGGGVCQVSTTLFRAALNTGLSIVERRSHSYRVGYYEQGYPPGLDATVFDPTTDLKIKNNTENHILIQTTFDEKNRSLTFDLYGTNDGRTVLLSKPIIKNSISPPEDLYIDDPTLKIGVIKQIEYKAWGAKVYFTYKVEKNGNVLYEKIFYSNYQPWQAKYLRGTGV